MSLPLVPHARHLSVLAKSVLVLFVFALASCASPKNRFDYDPDGTPKKKPKYPKLAKPEQKCVSLHQPGGNVVIAALEVVLGTFAFITPAAASTSMEEDLPLFRRDDAILLAGDSGGGGELILRSPFPCP